jgi:hypothetical protein
MDEVESVRCCGVGEASVQAAVEISSAATGLTVANFPYLD